MITTCQTCYSEGVPVTRAGYVVTHTRPRGIDRRGRIHCPGSGDLAMVVRRPTGRGANRRTVGAR